MKKAYLVNRIKDIIAAGHTLEACNHIELVARKDTENYNSYILIKNELNRFLNESMMGIISEEEKQLRLNQSNYKLIEYLSTLEDGDFYSNINPTKSQKEILEELQIENDRFQFSVERLKAIHRDEISEKNKMIRDLINDHRIEIRTLKEQVLKLEEESELLKNKVDNLTADRNRLRDIIRTEYANKKIWKS